MVATPTPTPGHNGPELWCPPLRLSSLASGAGLHLERFQLETPDLWNSPATRAVHLRRSEHGFSCSASFRELS